jgi:biotin transport system substrate-specific component
MQTTLLASICRADSRALRVAERASAVAFITALTAAAAQVSIPLPFTPVPFTLQPMIVLVGGAALGARLGMSSQLLYLALGIAGLPVFAAAPLLPQGAARLLGPSGGYLIAYPLAAFVAGALAERGFDRRYLTAVFAMACGLAVIFASGVLWLAVIVRPVRGFGAALAEGFYPFIAADVLKLLVAAGVMPSLWWLTGRSSERRRADGGAAPEDRRNRSAAL